MASAKRHLLALALVLLLGSFARRCFVGPAWRPSARRPQVEVAAESKDVTKAKKTKAKNVISNKTAVQQLDVLVQHLFKPKPGEDILEWTQEKRGQKKKTFRYTLNIKRLNVSYVGDWEAVKKTAMATAVRRAIENRLGDQSLGDAKAALSQLVRNAAAGQDVSTEYEERNKTDFVASVKLPDELIPDDSPAKGKVFMGAGKGKPQAQQSAARMALAFLCAAFASLPALAKLEKGMFRGRSTLNFRNFSTDATEESIRKVFSEFGTITDIELRPASRRLQGSVTYKHQIGAWAASRILNLSVINGRAVVVERIGEKQGTQQSWGSATSNDAVLFYKNAPFQLSFNDMLSRFREVVDLKSFRYWVEPHSQKSRGCGTLGFASKEAAREALGRLNGLDVQGRQLQVSPYERQEANKANAAAAAAAVATAVQMAGHSVDATASVLQT